MRAALLTSLLIAGCGTTPDPELASKAVRDAFAQANPSGRTGLEIRGKAVWFEAPYFDDGCLEQKELAFNDDATNRPKSGVKRISPTYSNQRWITAATPTGYCVYLGSDPGISVDTEKITWAGDRFMVPVKYTMGSPSPWFECLATFITQTTVEVPIDEDGQTAIEWDLSLKQGDCPSPLPGGEDRTPRSRPTKAPPKAPTVADAQALAQKMDDALFNLDFEQVRDLSICYNMFEKDRVGACSVAEFVPLGHSFHGQQRSQDGLPWMEYAISKIDDIKSIKKVRKDPTLFHAMMKHKRSGRDKSFSMQWVDGKWKMVGVVGLKAEGITHVRYIYDLHKADRYDVFERRLAGEELDDQGNPPPTDPWDEE